MAQLSRARDRSMHSIVATIQAEQDLAIRAPSKGVVTISGGPGTGKTVVALHRAAYLLYNDRRRYEAGGVLVVGPSGVFMRYIERVLPSLGETAVALRSLGEVVDGVRATRHDEPAVADVKGSARMAELMRRTSRQQAPGSPAEFRVFWYDNNIVLDRGVLGRVRRQLMSQGRRNRQLPRVAARAARRDVATGAQRARSRAGPRGVRRRPALRPRRSSTSRWPGGRRSTRRRCCRGCASRSSWPGWPTGVLTPEEQRLLTKSWAAVDGLAVGRGRAADRRAALRARRRADAHRRRARRPAGPDRGRGRHPGADDRVRPGVRPDRPGLGAAHPQHRRRRLRARAGRRGPGPHADAVADGRAPRPHGVVDDRRRPGAVVVAGAGGVRGGPGGGPRGQAAPRVPPVDQLPQLRRDLRVRRGRTPSGSASTPTCRRGAVDRAWSRWRSPASPDLETATREAVVEIAGQVSGTVGIVVPVGPALRGQRLAGLVAGVRRRRARARGGSRLLGQPRRATTGSSCSPVSTPRAWSSTGSSWSARRRSRPSRSPARATLYVVLTRATQLLTTVG